jgi:hypothetical protein
MSDNKTKEYINNDTKLIQPTGKCNFSKIDEIYKNINLLSNVKNSDIMYNHKPNHKHHHT